MSVPGHDPEAWPAFTARTRALGPAEETRLLHASTTTG